MSLRTASIVLQLSSKPLISSLNQGYVANRAYSEQMGKGMPEILQQICYSNSHQQAAPCPPTLLTCPLHEIRAGKKAFAEHNFVASSQIGPEHLAFSLPTGEHEIG